MMEDDDESLWEGLDIAANHFDNTLKALAALGDFGWKLTKDTATNTWKITEPIIKPAAKDIAKKLKDQGLKGWEVVKDKSGEGWQIVAPHATNVW